MAGKAPESAELKAVVEAYDRLSVGDQALFRSKAFALSGPSLPPYRALPRPYSSTD